MNDLMMNAFKSLESVEDEIVIPQFKAKAKVVKITESLDKDSKDDAQKHSTELKEEPTFDLRPEHDSRKSFYDKAWVDVKPDGTQILYSYGTPVCRIESGKATLLHKGYLGWNSSATTLRHVKEFLRQNNLEVGSLRELANMYPVESARVNESLINLNDGEEVAKAKEVMESSNEEKEEVIVDVDAETIDELKDSYVGNAILRCPICKTLIYKKPEDVIKGDGELYNVDEECPHCHEVKGFELVGQVAKLTDDKPKDISKEQETIGKEEPMVDEVSSDEEAKEDAPKTSRFGEGLSKEVIFEDIDSSRFDKLVNQYLISTYSNVSGYETTQGGVDDSNNTIVLEGIIKYKSGKEKETKFQFEAKTISKNGKIRFRGINETFSKSRTAFSLFGRLDEENCLVCDSLKYSYGVKVLDESKIIKGKAEILERKD